MKIIFLYSLLTPSVAAVLRALVKNHGASVVFFYRDKGGNKPFSLPEIQGVEYRPASKRNSSEIAAEVLAAKADLIYVTAWQERKYLKACRWAKKNGIPVISGFDDNWLGTLRQNLGALMVRVLRAIYFSHAMVSGPLQYQYASKFGFSRDQILYYLFSADTDRFNFEETKFAKNLEGTEQSFIFAGRYSTVKGIATLAAAYKIYRQKLGGKYRLKCFGQGDQDTLLQGIEGVEVHGYTAHDDLLQACRESVAFVLPSVYDPSPLVVHEMVLLGMPLVLSNNVGNRLMFLINGFNGYTFKTDDVADLATCLKRIEDLDSTALAAFRRNSARLSQQHSPDLTAASLVSVVSRP